MRDVNLEQLAKSAAATGPLVLMQGMRPRRPADVVRTASLSIDDKRAILAAWASDMFAVASKPALRHLPGTTDPVSIDEVQSALLELDQRAQP
jgi:hypothetical protein